jgi:transposase
LAHRSTDGLAILVKERFELRFDLDFFSPCLFVFCNRKHDKLKIFQWNHNGFWLHYRRLERGTFQCPAEGISTPLNINQRQLRWLLDGLPLEQRNAHPEVTACTVSPIINFVDPKEEFIKFCRILLFMKTTTNNLNQATQDLQK